MKVRITAIIPTGKGTDLVAQSAGCRADWAGLRDRIVREARTIGVAEARPKSARKASGLRQQMTQLRRLESLRHKWSYPGHSTRNA